MSKTLTRKRRRKASKIDKAKWASYAVAGAAMATGMSTEAEADITDFTIGAPVLDATPGDSAGVGAAFTIGSAYFIGSHYNFDGVNGAAVFGAVATGTGTANIAGFIGPGPGSYPYVSNLAYGQNVSTANFGLTSGYFGTMAFAGGYTYSQFLAAGTGYIGLQFDIGAGTQYGWVRVTMDGASLNSFTIVDGAFADPGESITVGQTAIPEPGSLGALALGAVSLLAWRRKRRQRPNQDNAVAV